MMNAESTLKKCSVPPGVRCPGSTSGAFARGGAGSRTCGTCCGGRRKPALVADDLLVRGGEGVDAADVGEADEVDHHVGDLVADTLAQACIPGAPARCRILGEVVNAWLRPRRDVVPVVLTTVGANGKR